MLRSGWLLGLLALAACGFPEEWSYGDNEIVFGIEQSRLGVAAGYDYIGLAKHGGSSAALFRDGDGRGRCWFERLDERLGHPHTEGGVATWSGGKLPGAGLTILANQSGLTKREGVAWETGDTLFFTAEGFAMPPFDGVRMTAPVTELALGDITPAPEPASGALALTPASELTVKWTPPVDDTRSRVMVALTTERAEVRCFDDAESGSAVIGKEWVVKLAGTGAADGGGGLSTTTGTLTIATHRQSTTFGRGNWIVYVVAAHVHRDIPFTMR